MDSFSWKGELVVYQAVQHICSQVGNDLSLRCSIQHQVESLLFPKSLVLEEFHLLYFQIKKTLKYSCFVPSLYNLRILCYRFLITSFYELTTNHSLYFTQDIFEKKARITRNVPHNAMKIEILAKEYSTTERSLEEIAFDIKDRVEQRLRRSISISFRAAVHYWVCRLNVKIN